MLIRSLELNSSDGLVIGFRFFLVFDVTAMSRSRRKSKTLLFDNIEWSKLPLLLGGNVVLMYSLASPLRQWTDCLPVEGQRSLSGSHQKLLPVFFVVNRTRSA